MSSATADTGVSSETVAASHRDERRVSLFILCLMALAIGIMTGVGAVALRALIGLIHNAMINGVFKIPYDANILEGPSRWGNWVILSPILGGLVVVYLVDRFAPEARGHGVPEVMDAIYYKRGEIRGVVAVIKSLASALSIGSGASVGREGRSSRSARRWDRRFRTRSASRPDRRSPCTRQTRAQASRPPSTPRSAASCSRSRSCCRRSQPHLLARRRCDWRGHFARPHPHRPQSGLHRPRGLLSLRQFFRRRGDDRLRCIGALCGVASWAFIRLLVFMEDGFPKLPGGAYTQNIIGMTFLGLMMVGLTHRFRPFLCRRRRLSRDPVDPGQA